MSLDENRVVVTGIGVVSPVGIGVSEFTEALKTGNSNFSKINFQHLDKQYTYPGAVVSNFEYKQALEALDLSDELQKKAAGVRNLSKGTTHGVHVALQAWLDAGLDTSTFDSDSVALITSGSNVKQADLVKTHERYYQKPNFINPTHAFRFLDTDLVGIVSELLDIKGEGYSIGAASASGNMALIQGHRLIASGAYDVVLVLAPSMELSLYEYQGFTALGAMATINSEREVAELCNPFDTSHCGFVYGENSGAVLLESEAHAKKRGVQPKATMLGYGTSMDANRNPNPSKEGEAKAMERALAMATLSAKEIGYINTHGTASVIGDETEIAAIASLGLSGIPANATKGLIGHGISSAGIVEAIATILQMNHGFLHPNPNLKDPLSDQLKWVQEKEIHAVTDHAISNSFGFGGINTSIVFKNKL